MKNIFYGAASIFLLASYSCKKSTDGNKSVLVKEKVNEKITTENGKPDSTYSSEKMVEMGNSKSEEITERYVAEDGSSALVTFKNSDKGHSISIRSNNRTITVPQKDSDGVTTVYENDGIVVKSENNIITITQGNNVIALKKARGQ